MIRKFLSGGDAGIFQRVYHAKQLVKKSLRESAQTVRKRAETILANTRERDERGEVETIFQWVKSRFHYFHDPTGLEYFKSPEYADKEIDTSGNGTFNGDCDDASIYLAALLMSVGYRVEFVTITPQNEPTNEFKHIYVRVFFPSTNQWAALDATAKGQPLGWEPPYKRQRTFPV